MHDQNLDTSSSTFQCCADMTWVLKLYVTHTMPNFLTKCNKVGLNYYIFETVTITVKNVQKKGKYIIKEIAKVTEGD